MRPDTKEDEPFAPYVAAVRAHPLVLLACTVVAVAIAIASVSRSDTTYTATSQLVVTPIADNEQEVLGLPLLRDVGDDVRTMETAAGLVDTTPIAEAAAETLGRGWDAARVRRAVDVRPRGQSNLIDIIATSRSASETVVVAQAFADAVISVRRDDLDRAVSEAIDALDDQLSRELSPVAEAELAERLRRLQPLLGRSDPTVALVEPARPRGASDDRSSLKVAAAAALGLGVGVAAALALNRGRPQVATSEQAITEVLPGPVVARLRPRWVGKAKSRVGKAKSRVGKARPRVRSEALDELSDVGALLGLGSSSHEVVLITSASPAEGSPGCVMALATALSIVHGRVLLIDADGRSASLTTHLGLDDVSAPWWDVPAEHLNDVVRSVDSLDGVELLPATAAYHADDQLLVMRSLNETIRGAIAWARQRDGVVLISGGSLGDHADLVPALRLVDDVLIVSHIGTTTVHALERLAQRLRLRGCVASGHVVLTPGRGAR